MPAKDASGTAAKLDAGRLRIALVHASDAGGGAEQCVMSLHRGLRASGHESILFVGEKRTQEPGVVEIPYVRGLPGSRRIARSVESMSGLQDIYNPSFRALEKVLSNGFDIIHFQTLWGSAGYADLGALPSLSRLSPSFLTLHDTWFLSGHCACFHDCMRWKTGCGQCPDLKIAPSIPRDATRLNWLRKRSVVGRSQLHVIAVSDWLVRQASNSPIFASCQVSRIYNGIDTSIFNPVSPEARQAARSKLGFGEQDFVVLMAGQTVEGVNNGIAAHHAVSAMNALSSDGQLRALVVGRSAQTVARQLQVPTVAMPFQQSSADMAACYQAADLTLVASEVETFGRIAAESQACGTPVVAFDSGGIPEVVSHGESGIVVPRGDTTALGQGIATLMSDRARRSEFALAGHRRVNQMFGQDRIAQEHVALYRSGISGSTS